jgi:hypothetical protein
VWNFEDLGMAAGDSVDLAACGELFDEVLRRVEGRFV